MNNQKVISIIIGVIALAAVIIGVIIAGSPQQARLEQFDQQRVTDLQNIEQAIINYASVQLKSSSTASSLLPTDLKAISNPSYGNLFFNDPFTNQPYEYTVLSSDSYQLCAFFSASNLDTRSTAYPITTALWLHPKGKYCFDLKINIQQLRANTKYITPLPVFPPVPQNVP